MNWTKITPHNSKLVYWSIKKLPVIIDNPEISDDFTNGTWLFDTINEENAEWLFSNKQTIKNKRLISIDGSCAFDFSNNNKWGITNNRKILPVINRV